VLAFKVSAFPKELLSPFIVNQACDWIGERSAFRVLWSAGSHNIALDHPPASEPQHAVQPSTKHSHFRMRRRGQVWATEGPGGHKGSILLDKDSIVDQSVVEEEIRETLRPHTMSIDLHFITSSGAALAGTANSSGSWRGSSSRTAHGAATRDA
jgi:hypothetical protein